MTAHHIDFGHFVAGECGADFLLDALGRGFTDQHVVLAAHVADDGFVELVTADAHAFGINDAVERDHRHLGSAAANVDHHRAACFTDRNAGAERCGNGFFDDVDLAGAGVFHRLADGAALHLGAAVGHTDHHAGDGAHQAAFLHLADEVLQHLLGNGVVGDHAIAHGADGGDVGGGAAEHLLGIDAHGLDLLVALGIKAYRDHRWFVEHDPLVSDVDQGVCGAEVNGQVIDEQATDGVDHRRRYSFSCSVKRRASKQFSAREGNAQHTMAWRSHHRPKQADSRRPRPITVLP